MRMNKKGVSLVELMMYVAIAAVLLSTAGIVGFQIYQTSIDDGIKGDLKAMSDATKAFMIDTNGVSPVFTPYAAEGTAPGAAVFGGTLGYDYTPGRAADTDDGQGTPVKAINLDFDTKGAELFTFNNILNPTYLDKIPAPRRSGQVYTYSVGDASTKDGAQAFAYSAILSGPKSQDSVNNNVSILNVTDVAHAPSATSPLPTCTTSNMKTGTAGVKLVTAGIQDDTTVTYRYQTYAKVIDATTGWTNALCDVYSEGQNVSNGNFINDNAITVNLK